MLPWLIALFLVFVDQLSKHLILTYRSVELTYPVIPRLFHITLVKNQGMAFGLFDNYSAVLTLLVAASILVLAWFVYRARHERLLYRLALAAILAGAMGNFVDRLRFHAVIDFLDFRIWPVFNIADSCITIGVGLLVLVLWRRT